MFGDLDPERGACQDMEVARSPCMEPGQEGMKRAAPRGWKGKLLGGHICHLSGNSSVSTIPTLSSKTEKA